MEIKRKSPISGNVSVRDIDVTADQLYRWQNGTPIQDAMPNLTPAEREFILSGITAEEWDKYMRDDEPDDLDDCIEDDLSHYGEATVFAVGSCYCCAGTFSFNPHKVPSINVDGIRHEVCLNCMTIANEKRVSMGLEPHPILPGAYDPIPEGEL